MNYFDVIPSHLIKRSTGIYLTDRSEEPFTIKVELIFPIQYIDLLSEKIEKVMITLKNYRILAYHKGSNNFIIFRMGFNAGCTSCIKVGFEVDLQKEINNKIYLEVEKKIKLKSKYDFNYFIDVNQSETRILFMSDHSISMYDRTKRRYEINDLYQIYEDIHGGFLDDTYYYTGLDNDVIYDSSNLGEELSGPYTTHEYGSSKPQMFGSSTGKKVVIYDQSDGIRIFDIMLGSDELILDSFDFTEFYVDQEHGILIALNEEENILKEWDLNALDKEGKARKDIDITSLNFKEILKKYYNIELGIGREKGHRFISFPITSDIVDQITAKVNSILNKIPIAKPLVNIIKRFILE